MSIGFNYKGKNVPAVRKKKADAEGVAGLTEAARRRLAKAILEAEGMDMLQRLLEEYVHQWRPDTEYYYQRMEELRLRYFHVFEVERKHDDALCLQQRTEQM